jgi:hypothetical protein
VPIIRSQTAFALGACGGLARILMPSAVNTASKESVNCPVRSGTIPDQELDRFGALTEVHQEIARCLRRP